MRCRREGRTVATTSTDGGGLSIRKRTLLGLVAGLHTLHIHRRVRGLAAKAIPKVPGNTPKSSGRAASRLGIHFFYGQLHRLTEGPGRGEDTMSFVTHVGGRGAPQKLTNPVSLPTRGRGEGGLGGGGMHEQPGFGWSLTQGRVRRMHRLVTLFHGDKFWPEGNL